MISEVRTVKRDFWQVCTLDSNSVFFLQQLTISSQYVAFGTYACYGG